MNREAATDIAEKFVAARRAAAGMSQYPGDAPQALESAYAIQDAAIKRFDESIGGWKVGRIWPPLSDQLGAERLAGPIFESSITYIDGNASPVGEIFTDGFGAAEAEFLIRIKAGVDPEKHGYTLDEAAALIDTVHIGIEIASSPFPGINELGPLVTISDFGNNNGIIVGREIADWQNSRFADWNVLLLIDGEEAGIGHAAAFPDGPVGSVRFLLENLASRNVAATSGFWVSSGAVTGVHEVSAGSRVEARFGADYSVSCTIEAAPTR